MIYIKNNEHWNHITESVDGKRKTHDRLATEEEIEKYNDSLIQEEQIIKKQHMEEIQLRLKKIDIKRFKFIDNELSQIEWEVYRSEAIALRLEYNELENTL